MNSLSFLVQALILLTGPGFISQSQSLEVTSIQNYTGGVQVWTEKKCVYPDPTLYMAQEGQPDAPVPALQVCGVVEAKKVDDRTEQDVFLSQLCQTIYLLSQSICENQNFSLFTKDKLENSLNYALMDVCDYAPILLGALKDSSTLKFFINGCEKMCVDNVKPLCRLMISAMCQFGHLINPSFTCTPKLLSSGATKITTTPPPPGSSGNNSPDTDKTKQPAAALPVINATAAPAPPAPVDGSNSDAAAPTAAKPTSSAAAGSTQNQDQPLPTGDNAEGVVPPGSNSGASPGGDGNSGNSAAGVPSSASPAKDGSSINHGLPKDPNSQTPEPVPSVVKPSVDDGAVKTPGSDPNAIPAGGSDPNPGLHPEHDDGASPADSLFSSTEGDGTGTPGSHVNVVSPQGQAETPGVVAGPRDNPAGAAVPTAAAAAVKTDAPPSSGNDPALGESNKNIVPTKTTTTTQQPAVPGSQDNAGVPPNANGNNVISSNDGSDLSSLNNKITKPTTQSINNGWTTNGFPQGEGVVDNDSDENYELPSESNQNQVPASQSESNNNHVAHPVETDEFQTIDGGEVPGSGHFFAYFLTAVVICISGYVIFHNKQKILAFIVEGRSGEGGRRRGNGNVQYSKLQSNVEEVMPSLDKATTAKNFVY